MQDMNVVPTLGPAMTALSPRRKAFVIALFSIGQSNHTEAFRMCGYKPSRYDAQHAYGLIHDEKVQAAIREEARRQCVADTPFALSVIKDIARGGADPKRLPAALALVNRGGIIEEQAVRRVESQMDINVNHGDKRALIEDIRRMALEMGVDPRALLGKVIDLGPADFAEVSEPEVSEPEDEPEDEPESW